MPKFLLRLFSFTFLLAAVPVISIGVISYLISSDDIEDKVKDGNMQVLLQNQMRVEQVLKTLELTALQYINSPLVTSSLDQKLGPDEFVLVRDLSKGLYNLQTFASINDAYFINLHQDWMVSFSSFGKLSDHPSRELFVEYTTQPNSLFWTTGEPDRPVSQGEPASSSGQQPSVNSVRMVYKVPVVPPVAQPKALLVVEILDSQIRGLLTMAAEKAQSTAESSGFFNAVLDEQELGVTYRSSPHNGWIYVSVVSIDNITRQSQKIAWITFAVCTLLFLLILLFAYYGSRRMYSPIKRLAEFTQRIQVDGAVHKDELLSIEARFHSLFSTEQELQQQLRGQFTQLKELFVLKLFTGQLSASDFADRSRKYGLPLEWTSLAVLTLQIDSLSETRYSEHDRELLMFAINNMVGELLPQNERFSPILLDHSQVTLIVSSLSDDAQLRTHTYETAEMIKRKIGEFLQLPVSIGISRPFDAVTGAANAYAEGLEALKCRMNLGNQIIVHYEDIDSGQKAMEVTVYTQLKLIEDQLVNALKLGDIKRVDEVLARYISAIVDKDIHFNEYPVLMMQLISKAYQLVQEQGGTINKVLADTATVEQFLKLNTIEEIHRWFRSTLFEPIIAFLNQQAESQYLNIANQMVKLVHERYDQDISLEACASMLNFHPVYLSRVFKREMGINFSEYLAEYRMSMAKNWLENTTWKISEIGEKLNYTNTTAFIRSFRKIIGMTPGQYREQHQNTH
ncbi:helix-turn-helix domain-containing protein [Paenibacillus xerothermodurans]|uniref:AraC family transcriptional regulator n=1 Tax=Paenibacillus xerothermodurans TaxID=1977292 RepID=A0A2W1N9C5_PAEXE|nr:helix-turn-helix domain-containing protein [Paenibacillus xerothermodurans]PZE21239.1 AraC family transcriptional regulator [Paenibacillus xerothermodurans]